MGPLLRRSRRKVAAKCTSMEGLGRLFAGRGGGTQGLGRLFAQLSWSMMSFGATFRYRLSRFGAVRPTCCLPPRGRTPSGGDFSPAGAAAGVTAYGEVLGERAARGRHGPMDAGGDGRTGRGTYGQRAVRPDARTARGQASGLCATRRRGAAMAFAGPISSPRRSTLSPTRSARLWASLCL
jgi:hypothetical protein